MRSKFLSILAIAVALIAGELQAEEVVFDNFDGGNGTFTTFGGGAGFPLSRTAVGDDFDTIAAPNSGEWLVNSVDFRMLAIAETSGTLSVYTGIQVTVSILDLGADSVLDPTAANPLNGEYIAGEFAAAQVLGTETFNLGTIGTAAGGNGLFVNQSVDFTNSINIGNGIGTGISFQFSDATGASEAGNLSVAYRNNGLPAPLVGTTSDRNYRDSTGDGNVSGAFGFTSNIGLAYSVNATATAVPEPTSFAVLGVLGLGFVTRRRR